MKMDPFIDTAILAEQTVQNAARLRDTMDKLFDLPYSKEGAPEQ